MIVRYGERKSARITYDKTNNMMSETRESRKEGSKQDNSPEEKERKEERKLPGPPMNLCPEKKMASLYE